MQIYKYDNAENQKNLQGKLWAKDPRYFKHVRISALALVKMVMHARSGGAFFPCQLYHKVARATPLTLHSTCARQAQWR